MSEPVFLLTRNEKLPVLLIVPPTTFGADAFGHRTPGSPVSIDLLMKEEPSTTCPSTGTFSPRLDKDDVAHPNLIESQRQPRIHRAGRPRGLGLEANQMFDGRAGLRPLARASRLRPIKIKVTITAADLK